MKTGSIYSHCQNLKKSTIKMYLLRSIFTYLVQINLFYLGKTPDLRTSREFQSMFFQLRVFGVFPTCTVTDRKSSDILVIKIQFRTIGEPTKPCYKPQVFFSFSDFAVIIRLFYQQITLFGSKQHLQLLLKEFLNSREVWRSIVLPSSFVKKS